MADPTPPDSPTPEPAIQVAARLLAGGHPAEAAEQLGRLVREAPTYAAAHVLRATALEAAGLVDQAIVSWGRAAALVPRSPLVHRERARLLATRLAEAPPADLPAAEPDPDRAAQDPEGPRPPDVRDPNAGAGAPPAADGVPDSVPSRAGPPPPPDAPPPDAPPPGDPTGRTLDPSDLSFSAAPSGSGGGAAGGRPPVPGSAPTSRPGTPPAPTPGPRADWASLDSAQATILPPETPPPSTPDRPRTASSDPPRDESGWGVLDESDVPTPPPGAYGEPDVVAPEPGARPGPTVADELDALITQLEDAPRIRPDPDYRGPDVDVDAGDVDDLASETLAKIYAAQHQYVEAALVYERLAARTPAQADELLERAAELRQRRP